MTQKTPYEIFQETLDYYTGGPGRRALSPGGSCVYLDSKTGNKCAVGRCLLPEVADAVSDMGGLPVSDMLRKAAVPDLDSALRPEYRGHGITFWYGLQQFHDNRNFWTETSTRAPDEKFPQLTAEGAAHARLALREFCGKEV